MTAALKSVVCQKQKFPMYLPPSYSGWMKLFFIWIM